MSENRFIIEMVNENKFQNIILGDYFRTVYQKADNVINKLFILLERLKINSTNKHTHIPLHLCM